MRILHVIPQFHYFGGQTIVGGHASCLMTLALAQHEAGHDVTILSFTEGRKGAYSIENGPAVYSLFEKGAGQTVRFGLSFHRAAMKWVTKRADEFDLIHFHSGFADYFLVSARLKAKTKLPTLHTLYCPIPEQGGRWRLPGVHGLINRWAKQLDWLGGMSENVAESMRHFGMNDVHFIPPPVKTNIVFQPDEALQLRSKLGIAADDLVILFVGNAKPQKNMIGVLRAFRKIRDAFPNAKLIATTELQQSSSDEALALLAKEIETLKIESHVIQQGIVDNMPLLMQASDVLVAPFLDSFGPSDYFMAALEAMACKKPVVVSKVGGMPEVVSSDVGELIDPHDPNAIAAGLARFLRDAELREEAGAKAKVKIEEIFSPRNVEAAYADVYRKIIA